MEEKKYCKSCGVELDKSWRVCPQCGLNQDVVQNDPPLQNTPTEEKKYCKFCGQSIDKNSIVCPKCGRQLEIVKETPITNINNQQPPVSQSEKGKGKKIISIIFAIIGSLIVLGIIFGGGESEQKESSGNNTTNQETNSTTNKKTTYSFDETFEFDDLEITIGKNYSFVKVDNEFSEHHKKEAVKLPVTIKNLSDETHSLNIFYYSIFGSQGTEVSTLGYFFDESIEEAGDLRTGASYTKYFYFIYDGNGTYAIEFNDIWNKKTVEIAINK